MGRISTNEKHSTECKLLFHYITRHNGDRFCTSRGWDRERGVGLGMECCATDNLLSLAVDKP